MWQWFNRWIWGPLGHILRVRALWQIWVQSSVWRKAGPVLIALLLSTWEWFSGRNTPEAVAILVVVSALLTIAWVLLLQRAAPSASIEEPAPPPSPSGAYLPTLVYECVHNVGSWSVGSLGDCIPQMVKIRNSQVAIANTANKVTAQIEYIHAGGDRFCVRDAPWFVVTHSGKDTFRKWIRYVFLAGNEAQSFLLFLIDVNRRLIVSEDFLTPLRGLQVGKWTARIAGKGDNCDPLEGDIGFTIFPDGRMEYDSPAYRPKQP